MMKDAIMAVAGNELSTAQERETQVRRIEAAIAKLAPATRASYMQWTRRVAIHTTQQSQRAGTLVVVLSGTGQQEELSDADVVRTIAELSDVQMSEWMQHEADFGMAPGTINIAFAAVRWMHRILKTDADWDIASSTLYAIKRDSDRRTEQKDGISWDEVERLCAIIQTAPGRNRAGDPVDVEEVIRLRDEALVRVMSDGLLRISEACNLDIEDWNDESMDIRRSKTDQLGEGRTFFVGGPTRIALQAYIEAAGIEDGPMFRSFRKGGKVTSNRLGTNNARLAIKYWGKVAGLGGNISGHSLRIGSAQSIAQHKGTIPELQEAGGWKDPKMPAHYAKSQLASQGVVARMRYGK